MQDIFTLSVPDMSCGHCRASIAGALQPLGAQPAFDMEARQVTVSGAISQAVAISALEDAGFDAAPVTQG
ncbi:heavy-metal-associated domain-containing protein [Pararhodobacter oceanensis]|uniref:heavy-metal-associated domain-containing protein n=1 Tax=Pararhodobacter oceanensis TaxID=2172121 RepID=UPI003A925ED4